MTLLGIDVGTTHCKAGLFELDGSTIHIASRPMGTHRTAGGYAIIDPDALWDTVAAVITEAAAARPGSVHAVGIASMAESGLLLEPESGTARTPMIPWFDQSSQPQADRIRASIDPAEFYLRSGLHISYKFSLAKILWLRDNGIAQTDGAVWLGAAEYVAYRLTGACGTEYSLAGRTGAFDVRRRIWDEDWLQSWDLDPSVFPPARAGGEPVGQTSARWTQIGVPHNTPVAISGHDHICAAFAAQLVSASPVFDSMGTAEVLVGAYPRRDLTPADYATGLSSGCHVTPGHNYWLGGLSTSGGAVEWLRRLLSDTPLSYADLTTLVESAGPEPTGILYFPYLRGSAAPHSDPSARGAWIGLHGDHTRAHLARAVLEGTAYEMEYVRRAGEQVAGPISMLTAAGGGTRNHAWLQITADVSGCPVQALSEPDITLLGAAIAAGMGQGFYPQPAHGSTAFTRRPGMIAEPDQRRHEIYRELYEQGFLPLQAPLRRFCATFTS